MKLFKIITGAHKKYSNWIRSLDRDSLHTETINILMLAADESYTESELHWKRRACCAEWIRRDGDDTEYCRALSKATVKLEERDDSFT
jgi:hypothetical protein